MRSLRPLLLMAVCGYGIGATRVDARGPIRERKREAAYGRGGGVGRKLSIQLSIRRAGLPSGQDGKTVIEFVLRNSGKSNIMLPVSPNPGDFEPPDANTTYSLLRLSLAVSSSKEPGTIFPGGAELYGANAVPDSLLSIAPGDVVHVLTTVAVPEPEGAETNAAPFVASASLDNETVTASDGKIVSDSVEVGFVRSNEYTAKSIPGPHD